MKRRSKYFWSIERASNGGYVMPWVNNYEDARRLFVMISAKHPDRTYYLVFR